MINLLLGPPGGGKSYEAVVYHVLPALKSGRKVITNLPLNLELFKALSDEYFDLIEIRQTTKKTKETPEEFSQAEGYDPITQLLQTAIKNTARTQKTINLYPFSNEQDYADKWRHPENGSGPLYIIDECHIALPYSGTPLKVEHWYSLHRHESADVLLITQSYSKINKSIRELVQVVYQVKKNTALGFQGSYTRKVKDGLKGEIVNTTQRTYEKKYFKYYQSHTRGGGSELAANDIVPIWKHWSFKGALIMFSIFGYMVYTGKFKMPFAAPKHIAKENTVQKSPEPKKLQTLVQNKIKIEPQAPLMAELEHKHPYEGLGIHILGSISSKKKGRFYLLGLSQNGQEIRKFSHHELIASGYSFTPISNCSARVQYLDVYTDFIRCDLPQTTATPATSTSI